ncbi:hypothetical protein PsorP6_009744 [Peronosclerospora sorghi]|uniref:Uncharacterized protein n=1 Tax=Peronosclerospora sorghi TaxID=230839 RepID=A0ACC0VZ45_9STRA|nr:hypothetical protein PsorP6_009744 [Peronosclerospora sorghi]
MDHRQSSEYGVLHVGDKFLSLKSGELSPGKMRADHLNDGPFLIISVWIEKIEVEAVELQRDAFPLPNQMRLVKGTLRQLRIDMPWTKMSNERILVDIQDLSLLLEVYADDRASLDSA